MARAANLVTNLKSGKVTGTLEVTVADIEAGTFTLAAFEADITLIVVDEGQFAQRLGDVDGAVFTVAVVEGVGSFNDTVVEIVDGLVEGPGTADNIVSTVGGSITDNGATSIQTVTSDQDGFNTESISEGCDIGTGVGTEDVEDGEALSDLGEVDTSTEGSLVGEFTNTSAAGITDVGAGRARAGADIRAEGVGAAEAFRAITVGAAGAQIATGRAGVITAP